MTALTLCIISAASLGIVKARGAYAPSEDHFTVVTSFYPMYVATRNVVGDVPGVTLRNLTQAATGCLHDYQLSAKDMKLMDGADAFVVNGAGMEGFLEEVLEAHEHVDVITATQGLELLEGEGHDHEEEEDHDHEGEEAHEHEEGHDHGAYNSHAWMNPALYRQQVENVAEGLAAADPGHRELYERNARAYEKRLKELEIQADQLAEEASAAGGRRAFLFHEAFAYLADACGMEVAGLVDLDEETALSAARLGEIIRLVQAGRVDCLLVEERTGKAVAESIARECDVRIVYVSPLTVGEETSDAYVEGMQENLQRIKEALEQ